MMRPRVYQIKCSSDLKTLDSLLFKALVFLNERTEPINLDVSGKSEPISGYRKFVVEEIGFGELTKDRLLLGGSVIHKRFRLTIKYKYPKGWGWSDVFMLKFHQAKEGIRVIINRVNGLGRTTPGYIIELLKTIIVRESYESFFEVTVYE